MDVQSRRALAGARVDITDGPQAFKDWLALKAQQYGASWAAMAERPDRKRTSPDGLYYFMDLPDGQYTLTASRPEFGTRYAAAHATANVSRVSGDIQRVAADMALAPTTIKGQVTGKNNDPVVMARIRISGSEEMTLSDGQGQYVLMGVEIGNRTLRVSAQGYQPASVVVTLAQAGASQNVNIPLTPNP